MRRMDRRAKPDRITQAQRFTYGERGEESWGRSGEEREEGVEGIEGEQKAEKNMKFLQQKKKRAPDWMGKANELDFKQTSGIDHK